MYTSKITGLGYYVPENVVTNDDLKQWMDTSDEWIQERTGIKQRRHVNSEADTTTSMGVEAAKVAIDRAGIDKDDIDFIVFATLSPDYYFPGPELPQFPELSEPRGLRQVVVSQAGLRQCFGSLRDHSGQLD